jgi:hypothetical protein
MGRSGPRSTESVCDAVYNIVVIGRRRSGGSVSHYLSSHRTHATPKNAIPGPEFRPFTTDEDSFLVACINPAWKSIEKNQEFGGRMISWLFPLVNQVLRRLADRRCAKVLPLGEGRIASD